MSLYLSLLFNFRERHQKREKIQRLIDSGHRNLEWPGASFFHEGFLS